MASNPKNQHYVPKCYLAEFCDPNTPSDQEPYVWVFDKNGKNRRRRAPKNLFTENHLYTFEFKGKKNFSIEQNLSHIEDKFAYVFRQKIKNKKPLSDQEYAHLCIFVAAQLQRTLRFKRNQENFIQQIIDHGTQIAMAHGIVSKQVEQWKEYKKEIHKIQLVEGIPFLANILMQMNVAFLCSKDLSRHWFITSDDPCVLFNPDLQWQRFYGPGFAQQNVQLTLPLSPEITAMFTWAEFHGYSRISNRSVEDLNRMERAHADKEFISLFPKRKLVWFSRIPIDPFFLIKIIRKETIFVIHRIRNAWQRKIIYARYKK